MIIFSRIKKFFGLTNYSIGFWVCAVFLIGNLAIAEESSITGTNRNKVLDGFFSVTLSMQADFTQTVQTLSGKIIEQSKGMLILSRPDKFVLAYNSPIEQKYISNGKTLWVYDVELEQVTIKALDDTIGDSPALLLSSNTNVYKHYFVFNGQSPDVELSKKHYQWVRLLAKDEQMTFSKVLLGFNNNQLAHMKLFDNFGQITELSFSNRQVNKPFALRTFHLDIPEGVDVIGRESGK